MWDLIAASAAIVSNYLTSDYIHKYMGAGLPLFESAPPYAPEPRPLMNKTSRTWLRLPKIFRDAYEKLEAQLTFAQSAIDGASLIIESNKRAAQETLDALRITSKRHERGKVGEIRIVGALVPTNQGTWKRQFRATVRVPVPLYGAPGVDTCPSRSTHCVAADGETPREALEALEAAMGAAYLLAEDMMGGAPSPGHGHLERDSDAEVTSKALRDILNGAAP